MRELCKAAQSGQRCIDDLCHTGGETLCGFCPYDWDDVSETEDYELEPDCMDCGMCDECVRRTRAAFEEMERETSPLTDRSDGEKRP